MFAFITGLMGLKSRVIDDWDGDHFWNEVMIGGEWAPVYISVLKESWAWPQPGGKTEFSWVLAYDNGKVIDVTDTYDKGSIGEREERKEGLPPKIAADIAWLMTPLP
jgi:hypothetical protein